MDIQRRTTSIPTGVLHHTVVLRQAPPAPVAFTAADTTQTIFLFGLPAKHAIVGIVANLTTSFAATGLSACTAMVGSTSQLNGSITSTNFLMPSFSCLSLPPIAGYGPISTQPSRFSPGTTTLQIVPSSIGDSTNYSANYFAGCTFTTDFGPVNTGLIVASSAISSGIVTLTTNYPNTDVVAGNYITLTRAATGRNMMYWSPFTIPNNCTDPQDIKATFTSTGAQLATLTAGEIVFTIMYRAL